MGHLKNRHAKLPKASGFLMFFAFTELDLGRHQASSFQGFFYGTMAPHILSCRINRRRDHILSCRI